MFRQEATSALAAGFHAGPLSRSNWNLEKENPENNPRSNARTKSKLDPAAFGTRLASNPGHIGGRQVLSPLRHPYSPQKKNNQRQKGYLE